MLAIAAVLATMAVRGRRWPWREASWPRVLLPFLVLAWHAYGTPLPSTLPAKLAQRDSGLWGTFGRGLIDWLRLFLWDSHAARISVRAGDATDLVAVDRRRCRSPIWRLRPLLPLLAWTAAFTVAYALLRVPFYHWYAAPAALGLCILGGAGLARAVSKWLLARAREPAGCRDWPVPAVAVIAAALAISLPPLVALPRTSRLNDTVRLYIEAGHWLATQTRPRAASATTRSAISASTGAGRWSTRSA